MAEDYKLTDQGVLRISTGQHIVENTGDPNWREYLAWVAEGNTADPADPPPSRDESDADRVTLEACYTDFVAGRQTDVERDRATRIILKFLLGKY